MESQSIHPRVVGGRAIHQKVDTSKPKKGRAKKYEKQARRLNLRQTACDTTRKSLPSGFNPEAYKMPGSMNQHKR